MLEKDFTKLLNHCTDSIVIFDKTGAIQHTNKHFDALPETIRSLFKQHQTSHPQLAQYQWQSLELEAGEAFIIGRSSSVSPSDQLLRQMLGNINNASCDVFAATVKAVHDVLGWRWVSVTRLVEGRAEVLAHWDTDHISDNFVFELAGTPCEVMAQNQHFTLFTDVQMAFPDNTALASMGAKCYAGIIYRNAQQQAAGHIMAIHDQREVDYRRTEDVLTLDSLALSANIELANLSDQLESALSASRTDPLTGLANRTVFDELCQSAVSEYRRSGQNCSLAILDLDGFKAFNDQHGHVEGDRLLRLMATELTKLGRHCDQAVRLGGDEFALVFQQASDSAIARIRQQIHDTMKRLSMLFAEPLGASLGTASLVEANGDVNDWYALADQRMYQEKASKS